MAKERVQKILAKAGICSRRKAEEFITEGAVTINGKLAKLGDQAEWGKDAIKVRGKLLLQQETPTYLAFFKPKGVICTLADPQGRPCLADYLSKLNHRVYPIGRLDFNSEGLVILTNDGEFAEKIQRKDDITRVYSVKVKGHPTEEMVDRLRKGARIGTEVKRLFKPHEVHVKQELANKAVVQTVVMGSGAFDLRAYFELKGFLVEKISRTSVGHLTLKGLEPGRYRLLKQSQAYALLEQPELGHKLIEEKPKLREKAPRITPRRDDNRDSRASRDSRGFQKTRKIAPISDRPQGQTPQPPGRNSWREETRRHDRWNAGPGKPWSASPSKPESRRDDRARSGRGTPKPFARTKKRERFE